ncbi:MAG TPA: pilin [Candidatus Saccharimonadales bacterium]|nr:pilin [Candidatus Saccharimonadales bacterium]
MISFFVEGILSLGMIFSFTSAPLTNFAACEGTPLEFLGLESWDHCLTRVETCNNQGDCEQTVVINSIRDIWKIIIPLFNDVLKLAGYIAIGFVIWGGIQYTKSQGEPSNLSAAKDTIKNAIIGLIIVLSSIAITQFIYRGFVSS